MWRSSRAVSILVGLVAVALGGAVAVAQIPPPSPAAPPPTPKSLWCGRESCDAAPKAPSILRGTPTGGANRPLQSPAATTPTAAAQNAPTGTDERGVSFFQMHAVAKAGATYRVADVYLTVPPGGDLLLWGGSVSGPGGSVLVFQDVESGSFVRVDAQTREDRGRQLTATAGADVSERFDAFVRSARSAR